MLKQTQSQKLNQKILPQIIQRQSLLAVPTIALEQMMKQELELNPFLEDLEIVEMESPTQEAESTEKDKTADDTENSDDNSKADEYNWDDYFENDSDGYKTNLDFKENESYKLENMWKDETSFSDNLISQLHMSGISDKEIYIGEHIIGNLDEDGYLRETDEELLAEIERMKYGTEYENESFTLDEVKTVLDLIKRFEPVGIASRNLVDCLLTQLDELAIDSRIKNLCDKILNNYFEEFRLKNYEKICKELQVDQETVNKVFDTISKLNPKPGISESLIDQTYIYPDLIVTKKDEEYIVTLNDKGIPQLRLNNGYRNMIMNEKTKLTKETKDFVQVNFERAKWFLDAIKSRRETMMKVMNSILIRQFDFFENKGEGLKPMYEKDVAEDINMDISTVSRTVRGKYVQTDFGIYELKFFFSNYLKNEDGDDISTKEIKNKIKEIIEKENSAKPFTDDDLANELNNLGFKIARRTVAKYREAMNIPKARLRRKL
ncbi:MAG TPA: RNA polymerase factor sigma-54 [Ignavibacteria bacterium]|nr:RNA polymerase factor sigma-54 [Ignavibacteria bacterium]